VIGGHHPEAPALHQGQKAEQALLPDEVGISVAQTNIEGAFQQRGKVNAEASDPIVNR
jgi:hypothetical protein